MNTFSFSPSKNMFYMNIMKSSYVSANTWPDDCIDIDNDTSQEFAGTAPEGKVRVAGDDGMPAWGVIPHPTQEELAMQTEQLKQRLRVSADYEISWRQDAVDEGIATENEATALAEWKKYRVLLMRVGLDKPDWPPVPA